MLSTQQQQLPWVDWRRYVQDSPHPAQRQVYSLLSLGHVLAFLQGQWARSVGPRSVSHTETMDNGCQTRGNPKRERGLDRNMDGPRDAHTERNKSDRERQISYDVAYTWNLKKWHRWTCLRNRKLSHRCRKQTYGYQQRKKERDKLGDWDWRVCVCVCVCAKSPQSCLTLCHHMDCSPPGSSFYRISQARMLEYVAISSSRRSFQPRDWTYVSYIGRWVLSH